MNGMNRDTGALKKVLLGAVAAGSGLALYYGFIKWKSRPDGKGGVLDLTEEPKPEAAAGRKEDSGPPSSELEPPLQTSTPGVSRASSTDTTLDPLSLSGSFEKVSLSALKENHDTGDESLSGERSPSESFEKVSLPPESKGPVSKDAPRVDVVSLGGGRVTEVVYPPGGNSKAESPESIAKSSSSISAQPRVQFEEKVLKADISSVQSTPKSAPATQPSVPTPGRPRPEGKADPPRPSSEALSSDSVPPADLPPPLQPKVMALSQIPTLSKPAAPPPVAPKPTNKVSDLMAAQKTSQPQPHVEKTSPTPASHVQNVPSAHAPRENAEDGGNTEEEEDEDEDGSASDASGDSQVDMTRGDTSPESPAVLFVDADGISHDGKTLVKVPNIYLNSPEHSENRDEFNVPTGDLAAKSCETVAMEENRDERICLSATYATTASDNPIPLQQIVTEDKSEHMKYTITPRGTDSSGATRRDDPGDVVSATNNTTAKSTEPETNNNMGDLDNSRFTLPEASHSEEENVEENDFEIVGESPLVGEEEELADAYETMHHSQPATDTETFKTRPDLDCDLEYSASVLDVPLHMGGTHEVDVAYAMEGKSPYDICDEAEGNLPLGIESEPTTAEPGKSPAHGASDTGCIQTTYGPGNTDCKQTANHIGDSDLRVTKDKSVDTKCAQNVDEDEFHELDKTPTNYHDDGNQSYEELHDDVSISDDDFHDAVSISEDDYREINLRTKDLLDAQSVQVNVPEDGRCTTESDSHCIPPSDRHGSGQKPETFDRDSTQRLESIYSSENLRGGGVDSAAFAHLRQNLLNRHATSEHGGEDPHRTANTPLQNDDVDAVHAIQEGTTLFYSSNREDSPDLQVGEQDAQKEHQDVESDVSKSFTRNLNETESFKGGCEIIVPSYKVDGEISRYSDTSNNVDEEFSLHDIEWPSMESSTSLATIKTMNTENIDVATDAKIWRTGNNDCEIMNEQTDISKIEQNDAIDEQGQMHSDHEYTTDEMRPVNTAIIVDKDKRNSESTDDRDDPTSNEDEDTLKSTGRVERDFPNDLSVQEDNFSADQHQTHKRSFDTTPLPIPYPPPSSGLRRNDSMASTSSSASNKDTDNMMYTFRRLRQCFVDVDSKNPSHYSVHLARVGNLRDVDFGMDIIVRSSPSRGYLLEVDGNGLAQQAGVRTGDSLLFVNGVSVQDWRPDVLQQYMSMVDTGRIELVVYSSETQCDLKLDIHLTDDKGSVRLMHENNKTTIDVEACPVELGDFTPKICHLQSAQTGQFLMNLGGAITINKRGLDYGPYELMRLLFARPKTAQFQAPVTMLAFCDRDILFYACATSTSSVRLMRQTELTHDVETLQAADCRFFYHKFIAGCDCFESVLYPDHYLCCETGRVMLRQIPSSVQLAQHSSAHFQLHYLFVPTEDCTEL